MPPETDLHPWLAQFPKAGQAYIIAWFHYSVSQGATTPEAVLEIVTRVCSRKRAWAVSETTVDLCTATLGALVYQRAGALSYAQTVLAWTSTGAYHRSQ